MEVGRLRSQNTILWFLNIVPSMRHLLWKKNGDSKEQKLPLGNLHKNALKCAHCGTVVIPRLAPLDWKNRPRREDRDFR